MSVRSPSEVWKAFARHWDPTEPDAQAAIYAVYLVGVQDGPRRPRRTVRPIGSRSDRVQSAIARALPVVQSIAYLKNVPEATLIDGSDYEAARERQEAYYV